MGAAFYREWKVEQDMIILGQNTKAPIIDAQSALAKYILHPSVPGLDSLAEVYQPHERVVNGRKVVSTPTPGLIYYGFPTQYIDSTLAKAKGLADAKGQINQTYLRLEAVYRAAFNALLDYDGVLEQADQGIASGQFSYPRIPAKTMRVYQKYASFGRSYVYLENDFYIEKLDENDLNLLKDPTQDSLQGIMDMVARTYKDVVTIGGSYPADATIGYGSGGEDAVANGTVVLAVGYDLDLEQWPESLHDSAVAWIQQQADSLQSELSQQLGCAVAVIVNNDGYGMQ
jgi:hypothetical protein